MVDTTWTNGGGDGKASTAANWSNGIDVGYNVIFDGTSTANCTFDYDGQLGTFTIAAGYTGTITQSSDMHISSYTQEAGIFTALETKWVYCDGSFLQTGGSLPSFKIRLELTGNGTLRMVGSSYIMYLKISADVVTASNINCGPLYINTDKTLTIGTGFYLYYDAWASNLYTNNGTINGGGTFLFGLHNGDRTLDIGNINSFFNIISRSDANGNYKLIITDDFSCSVLKLNDAGIVSIHASYTCALDLNGHNLTASSITVGTRGILQCGEGTITTGSLDSSAGTVTAETSQLILDGAGTLKTNGSDKFYDVVVRDDALVTLASNVTVSNELVTAGEIALAGNTLTHESPSKRYSAPMINPIVRNPKRSPIFRGRFTRNFEKGVV